MKKIIRWGLITSGTVFTFLIIAGVYQLTQEEYNHTYVCSKNGKLGIFENLSNTNKTGYWTENNTIQKATCTAGTWTLCKETNHPSCKNITVMAKPDIYTGRIWCYDKIHCEPIVE